MSSYKILEGELIPIKDRVIVSDMSFDSITTKGGIILNSDNGKVHGIKPRWAKVYAKGKDNTDEYTVGDWILVEHGRWTRGVKIKTNHKEQVLQMVEAKSVMIWAKEKPEESYVNKESQL
jgi:co-chaperonin GroES (HSP10)